MTTDLALRDPVDVAERLYKSGLFKDTKDAHQALAKILSGGEYGLGPAAALNGLHIIDSKIVPSAHVIAGLVKRGKRYDYYVKRHDNTVCDLLFVALIPGATVDVTFAQGGTRTMPGMFLGESKFTFAEDAKRAGLASRQNWQRYPRNMLFARALANGVRWYCPDVTQTGQVLVAEEAADLADVDYTPPGAVAEPVRVENVAQKWQPTETQITELRELYGRSGWAEGDSDHDRLRMALAATGAGNAGSIGEVLAALTEEQFRQVREALVVAATAETFDATEEA